MTTEKELEATYGPAAPYSEHKRGQRIKYQADDFTYTGEILYVQAAARVGEHDLPPRYVVAPADGVFIDIVLPSDVLEG
jgi:hypothetical protein